MAEPSLALLQALTERLLDGQRRMDVKLDRVLDDVTDLKSRMTGAEEGLAGVNRRLDRVDVRLARVEHRLELAEHPC